MTTTIPVLAATAFLVTAREWVAGVSWASELCEWFTNADEATDRAEYLNAQVDRNGKHRFTNVKIEFVNH